MSASSHHNHPPPRPRTVALIGGAGLVGRAVAGALHLSGHRVVVADVVSPVAPQTPGAGHDPGLRFLHVDLLRTTAPQLAHTLRRFDVDVVVHLAAQVNPPRDVAERARMRRLHLDGAEVVARATTSLGCRLVLVSSATVYGAHPDNPVPLEVDTPLRPTPLGAPLPYAEDKAAQEDLVRGIINAGDGTGTLSVVRPAIVYGPEARNYLTEIIRRARLRLGPWSGGILPAINGHRPPLQFVHVDDVGRIIAAAAIADVVGDFHAASEDWIAFDDVAAAAGLRVVPIPSAVLTPLLDGMLRFMPPAWRAPSALLPYLEWPFVVSMASTMARLDVRPRHSSAEALRSVLSPS